MPASPVELLHEWKDFFIALGAASAALVGAMFVAASVGIGYFTRDHTAAIRSFLTPTTIHFSAVLVASTVAMVPTLDWGWLSAILAVGGALGAVYSGYVAFDVARRRSLARIDYFWYGAAPVASYLIVIASSVMAAAGAPHSVDLLALASLTLLIGSIRNGWDMIVFLVTQERGKEE